MPFVQIQPKLITGHAGMSKTKITMGAYLAEGVKRPRHITFRIPRLVMEQTNFVMEAKSTIVGLHEGVGEDTGFLMLFYTDDKRNGAIASQANYTSKTNRDFVNEQGFTATYRFERFQYYAPNEWPISAIEVNHLIDEGNIVIECPDWFRPNVEKMKADGLWKEKPPQLELVPPPIDMNRQQRRAVASAVASAISRKRR